MTGQVPPYPAQHQQQQLQGRMSDQHPSDNRIDRLEVRMGGVEDGIKHIVAKLEQRDKTPWGMIFTAGGVVITLITAIGSLAFTPLNSGINDLKLVMVKFENKTDGFMKREDIEARIDALRGGFREQFDIGKERRNDLQAKTDERINRVEHDLDALVKGVVPREQHDTLRQLAQREVDFLRDRMGRIEQRNEKQFDAIDHRIERLGDATVPRPEVKSILDGQRARFEMLGGELDRHLKAFDERQQHRIDTLEIAPRR